jgi:hypothetical protein
LPGGKAGAWTARWRAVIRCRRRLGDNRALAPATGSYFFLAS